MTDPKKIKFITIPNPPPPRDPMLEDVLRIFERLDPETRKEILDYMEQLADEQDKKDPPGCAE